MSSSDEEEDTDQTHVRTRACSSAELRTYTHASDLESSSLEDMEQGKLGSLDQVLNNIVQGGALEDAQKLLNVEGMATVRDRNGHDALITASRSGRLDLVRWLVLRKGVHPHTTGHDGANALHWAIIAGEERVARWLVEGDHPLRADPHVTDNEGNNAMHYASCCGHLTILEWLVADAPAGHGMDLCTRNKAGHGSLWWAKFKGHKDVLHWLINSCGILQKEQALEAEAEAEAEAMAKSREASGGTSEGGSGGESDGDSESNTVGDTTGDTVGDTTGDTVADARADVKTPSPSPAPHAASRSRSDDMGACAASSPSPSPVEEAFFVSSSEAEASSEGDDDDHCSHPVEGNGHSDTHTYGRATSKSQRSRQNCRARTATNAGGSRSGTTQSKCSDEHLPGLELKAEKGAEGLREAVEPDRAVPATYLDLDIALAEDSGTAPPPQHAILRGYLDARPAGIGVTDNAEAAQWWQKQLGKVTETVKSLRAKRDRTSLRLKQCSIELGRAYAGLAAAYDSSCNRLQQAAEPDVDAHVQEAAQRLKLRDRLMPRIEQLQGEEQVLQRQLGFLATDLRECEKLAALSVPHDAVDRSQ